MSLSRLSFLLPALGSLALVSPMWGTAITGGASISGFVTVSATSISFQPTFLAQGASAQVGSFSGLTSGVFNVPTLTGPPLEGSVNVPDFITFSTGVASPIMFDLQTINPGFGTAANCTTNALGQPCTPPGSPFTLTQATPTEVAVNLTLAGISYTGTSASGSSPTSAIFSTQLTIPPDICNTVTSCLAMLSSGGSVSADFAANFTATSVPEPASMLLLGAGLVGAGSFARMKLRKG